MQVSAVRTQIAELRASLSTVNGEILIATGVRPGSAGTGGASGAGAVHEEFGAIMAAFYATAMDAFRQAEVGYFWSSAIAQSSGHCTRGMRPSSSGSARQR